MKILEAVQSRPPESSVRLIASVPNFEAAYLAEEVDRDKPYHAIEAIKADSEAFARIKMLLLALVHHDAPLPPNALTWDSLEQLQQAVSPQ